MWQVQITTAALWRPGVILVRPTLLGWLSWFFLFDGFLRRDIDLIRLRAAAFKLAYRLTKSAANFWQFLPTENDKRDDHDDDEFLQTKPKHVYPSSSSIGRDSVLSIVPRPLGQEYLALADSADQ